MNDSRIKLARTGKIVTKKIINWENDIELMVTYDTGAACEISKQMGNNKDGEERSWYAGGCWVFRAEADMIAFAEYFAPDGSMSKARPATDAQISYLVKLGVKIEDGMTVARASELIDAAKRGELGSFYGFYTDGSN